MLDVAVLLQIIVNVSRKLETCRADVRVREGMEYQSQRNMFRGAGSGVEVAVTMILQVWAGALQIRSQAEV